MIDLVVLGGGAAGIFAAIQAKTLNPATKVVLLEKSAVLLAKVKVSGGGRCNVTHACFDPKLLVKHYPRGEKELLGPFHRFGPQDTIDWFEARGVPLKVETDGRMFPLSNRSESIIECLLNEAGKLGVEIRLRARIEQITASDGGFTLKLKQEELISCKNLLFATGSSPEGYQFLEQLGVKIESPVPSLFTFNVPTSALKELSGNVVDPAELQIKGASFVQKGPLLITHFGFSGPAALKLSAWAARYLHEKDYKVELLINWLPEFSYEEILEAFLTLKKEKPQKNLEVENLFKLPKKLWKAFIETRDKRLCELSLKDFQVLSQKLHSDSYQVEGKTTNKEEFVTCGGVNLKEVDFKTMQSKTCKGLFFAGEVLNIDGVTGGFNFQNAWTTGFIAGTSAAGEG